MRARFFVVLLTIVVGTLGITTVISRGTKGSSDKSLTNPSVPVRPVKVTQDPVEIVDGAQTPEKIPDRVAYTLLFRFLSGRKTEAQKNSARSYLRMVFGCDTCPDESMTKKQRAAVHIHIEKLLAVAEDFETRNRPVDDQAKRIRERGGHYFDSSARTQLKNLETKKEALVMQIMATLSDRLGAEGAEKLHGFLIEQFKRRVKIHSGRNSKQPIATGNAS